MAGLSHPRGMLVFEAEALILLDLEQTLTEAGVETVGPMRSRAACSRRAFHSCFPRGPTTLSRASKAYPWC